MRKNFIAITILIILSLLALHSLLIPGFYTSHDGATHTARIANYFLVLTDFQVPPRWAPLLNGGMGSPIFVYIYPLPYLFGSLVHYLGFSFTDSYKVVLGLAYFSSGLTFFLWMRRHFSVWASLAAASVYLFSPYRFSLLFVRGAYAESIAYTFIPLIFLAIDGVFSSKSSRRWIAFGAISTSLLMLSHNLVAFIFLPLVFLYALVLFRHFKKPSSLVSYFIFTALGFLLSAFIYLPDFLEKKYIRFDELISYYQNHFVYFWQFLRSPWDYGFSFIGQNDAMSFQIGLGQLLIFSVALVLLVKIFLTRQKNQDTIKLLFFLSLFVGAVVLMLESPLSRFLWKSIPGLATIDYPWRLLGVTTFSLAAVSAIVVQEIKNKFQLLTTIIIIFAVVIANRNHLRINQQMFLPDSQLLSYAGSATHLGEFTPVTRSTSKFIPFPYTIQVISGKATIVKVKEKSAEKVYQIDVSEFAKIRLNTLYFPGWQINLDGQHLKLESGFTITGDTNLKTDVDQSGLIYVDIPKGKHILGAKFRETPVRQVGNFVSLGAFLIVLLLLVI